MKLAKMILAIFILSLSSGVFSQDDPIPTGLGWNPSVTQLAVGYSDGHIEIIDAITGQTIYNLSRPAKEIFYIRWSPDDTKLATAGNGYTVNIWDTTNGQLLNSFNSFPTTDVSSIGWSSDGNYLIVTMITGDPNLNIIDIESGSIIHLEIIGTVNDIIYSPNGNELILALHVGEIQIRDEDSFEVISIFEG